METTNEATAVREVDTCHLSGRNMFELSGESWHIQMEQTKRLSNGWIEGNGKRKWFEDNYYRKSWRSSTDTDTFEDSQMFQLARTTCYRLWMGSKQGQFDNVNASHGCLWLWGIVYMTISNQPLTELAIAARPVVRYPQPWFLWILFFILGVPYQWLYLLIWGGLDEYASCR